MSSLPASIIMRGAFATLLLSAFSVLFAQTGPLQPSFEVATIQLANPSVTGPPFCHGGPGTITPERVDCGNYTLEGYIRRAYQREQPWEVVFPRSSPADRYDIVVKFPRGTSLGQLNLMFQNLLAERFGLVMHTENRVMQAFELVIAKDGPRISASKDQPDRTPDRPSAGALISTNRLPRDKNGWPILPPDVKGIGFSDIHGYSRVMFREQPLSEVVRALKPLLRRPVTDKTGLVGNFSFDLTVRWPSLIGIFSNAVPGAPTAATDLQSAQGDRSLVPASTGILSPMVESVLTAMERQLGLKLVLRNGPVEVLVVDRFNAKPTEN